MRARGNGREGRLGLATALTCLFALIGGRLLGDTLLPSRPLLGFALGALIGAAVAVVLAAAVHRFPP